MNVKTLVDKKIQEGNGNTGGGGGGVSPEDLSRLEERLFNKLKDYESIEDTGFQPMERVCKFYGYPIAINGAWNIDKAAEIYSQYDIVVWGDGYQLPTHSQHENTVAISNKLRELNPKVKIFGYVPIGLDAAWDDSNHPMEEVQRRIQSWTSIGATHIFLDEFGYDYEVSRERQNACIEYTRSLGMDVCANSWDIDYVFSNENIIISWRNNFEGNPNNLPSIMGPNDYIQFENILYFYDHPPGTPSIPNPTQRVKDARRINDMLRYTQQPRDEFGGRSYYEVYGTKGYALDANVMKDDKIFFEGYMTALIAKMEAYGSSVAFWGAADSDYFHHKPPKSKIRSRDEIGTTKIESFKGVPNCKFTTMVGKDEVEII